MSEKRGRKKGHTAYGSAADRMKHMYPNDTIAFFCGYHTDPKTLQDELLLRQRSLHATMTRNVNLKGMEFSTQVMRQTFADRIAGAVLVTRTT